MTMITPSYLGETIEYSSLHACRSTLEDPTEDVTTPTVRRETVIKKAEDVIQKSLETVQQIASLLGENAAETEIMLNSLIDAFKVPPSSQSDGFTKVES